ncbi:LysM peptidoglycan-binding domain-containing protein [Paenibacillus sp. A14]
MIGQVICIPSYELSPARYNGYPFPNRSQCGLHSWNYTIQKGDTYYELSHWVKITPDKLMSANPGIAPQALVPGQNLCIPLPYWNAALPQSKGIDTGYGLVETAYYLSSSQGYYFYVLPEYTPLISIKPREDHLVSYDEQSHVSINRLFYETLNVHEMREFLRKELSSLGPVNEIQENDRDPFFKKAAIFLSADVEERVEQRIVLFIGEMVLYFKISLAQREAYDELARVYGMLRTIITIPDPSFHE